MEQGVGQAKLVGLVEKEETRITKFGILSCFMIRNCAWPRYVFLLVA